MTRDHSTSKLTVMVGLAVFTILVTQFMGLAIR